MSMSIVEICMRQIGVQSRQQSSIQPDGRTDKTKTTQTENRKITFPNEATVTASTNVKHCQQVTRTKHQKNQKREEERENVAFQNNDENKKKKKEREGDF